MDSALVYRGLDLGVGDLAQQVHAAGEIKGANQNGVDTRHGEDVGAPRARADCLVAVLGHSDSRGFRQWKATGRFVKAGEHAFHIHDVGKCEPPFASAGGHFNPHEAKHGLAAEEGPHSGDLPNVFVAANGEVTVNGTLIDSLPAWVDPERDVIIEIATIVTDKDLTVLAEGPATA